MGNNFRTEHGRVISFVRLSGNPDVTSVMMIDNSMKYPGNKRVGGNVGVFATSWEMGTRNSWRHESSVFLRPFWDSAATKLHIAVGYG